LRQPGFKVSLKVNVAFLRLTVKSFPCSSQIFLVENQKKLELEFQDVYSQRLSLSFSLIDLGSTNQLFHKAEEKFKVPLVVCVNCFLKESKDYLQEVLFGMVSDL